MRLLTHTGALSRLGCYVSSMDNNVSCNVLEFARPITNLRRVVDRVWGTAYRRGRAEQQG